MEYHKIFYYSSQCDKNKYNCKDLLKIMESNINEILQMFTLKCVDRMSDVELTRSGVEKVPTIVLMTIQNKQVQSRGLYVGKQAYEWVNSIIENKRMSIQMQSENTRKNIQMDAMKKRMKDGMVEYFPSEMEGKSDSYAFWADDITRDIDHAQPKAFLPVGEDGKYSILTIPDNNNSKYKLTRADQEKLIKNEQNIRGEQDTTIKQVLERQQINTVISRQQQ